ncbi:MAG: sigma-70 family RNA polymerase sigma factor [Phycisphaerae bacterium]|nr:sigma-70 family RNA polymerase sigma factor [Phycisphaerae bacterium]NUQ45025.1 sigma-70 family RNA polymerase sigma factor [Phycisphaerae bacterium]
MRSDVTQILAAIDNGDAEASKTLLPLVYDELRKLAAQRMKEEAAGHTLQATALVHEAYLRLVGSRDKQGKSWDSRGHFFAAAAEAMRRILIDRARAKGAQKRSGNPARLRLGQDPLKSVEQSAELLDLDAALQKLAGEDPVKAELVKLRFFAGLTLEEAGRILGISPATADRHWSYARAWLYHEMSRR